MTNDPTTHKTDGGKVKTPDDHAQTTHGVDAQKKAEIAEAAAAEERTGDA